MHETYRMLGREYEADFERQARKWQRADDARRTRGLGSGQRCSSRLRPELLLARVAVLAHHRLRAERELLTSERVAPSS